MLVKPNRFQADRGRGVQEIFPHLALWLRVATKKAQPPPGIYVPYFLGRFASSKNPCTRIPGLVREHRADKANDDIGNSARTKGCVENQKNSSNAFCFTTVLVELSIYGFYWIFATLAHAQNESCCSRTNPGIRVRVAPTGSTRVLEYRRNLDN